MRPLLLVCFLNLYLTFQIYANKSLLFDCDFNKIEKELHEMSILEEKVNIQNVNYQAKTVINSFESSLFSSYQESESSFRAGPFFAGCCLGVPGVAIIYLTQEEDKEAIKSSIQGYLLGKIIIYGIYLGYYFLILSQVPTTTI